MADEQECPEHGRTLIYADPQPDDGNPGCLLQCCIKECTYEVHET